MILKKCEILSERRKREKEIKIEEKKTILKEEKITPFIFSSSFLAEKKEIYLEIPSAKPSIENTLHILNIAKPKLNNPYSSGPSNLAVINLVKKFKKYPNVIPKNTIPAPFAIVLTALSYSFDMVREFLLLGLTLDLCFIFIFGGSLNI